MLLVAGLLAACQTTKPLPTTTVRTVESTYYPNQPDIALPTRPRFQNFEYDFPRRTDLQQLVKNTTACKAVPVAQQDQAFWRRCGEFPVDTNSNIFIGFTQPEWDKFIQNWAEVEAYVKVLEERIAEVNRQRARYRELGAQQRVTQ